MTARAKTSRKKAAKKKTTAKKPAARKKAGTKKAAKRTTKKTTRKKAARKKAVRRKAAGGGASAQAATLGATPVRTLTQRYQDYFDKVYGSGSGSGPHILCCGSAAGIPDDDKAIGPYFANLAQQAIGANDVEQAELRDFPPRELRTFREGLLAVFGQLDKTTKPARCLQPVRKAKFQGFDGHSRRRISWYDQGDQIVFRFEAR